MKGTAVSPSDAIIADFVVGKEPDFRDLFFVHSFLAIVIILLLNIRFKFYVTFSGDNDKI